MQMHNPPHPGEVLRDYMGNEEVTAFAGRVGVNRVSMSRLLNGQTGISAQMALSLASVLSTSAEMWMNLQTQYELWHAREDRRLAGSQQRRNASAPRLHVVSTTARRKTPTKRAVAR